MWPFPRDKTNWQDITRLVGTERDRYLHDKN